MIKMVVQLNAFQMHKAMQWRLSSTVAMNGIRNEMSEKKGVKMPIAQKPLAGK